MDSAVLLIGPTGSGKTPLGRTLEARGYHGRPCVHFDFGESLRRAAAEKSDILDEESKALVRDVLHTGALLEDEHFHIAATILRRFLADRNPNEPGERALVVLNGLPRHAGQARDVDSIVKVVCIVHLTCSAETVYERIGSNAGGDRLGRTDDEIGAVRAKLSIFAARTAPLIKHYWRAGAEIRSVSVGPATTAEDAWNTLNSG